MPSLLTIAGTDPSGGAGLPIDLQVFRDFDYHGFSVVTAVVWQNTRGVRGFEAISGDRVQRQLRAVFDDLPVSGVKTGMLPTPEVVEVVADVLGEEAPDTPIVVDPVLAGGGEGRALHRSGTVEAIVQRLAPLATVLTPNISEAEYLGETEITTRDEASRAASNLRRSGAEAVLLKVGHLPTTEHPPSDTCEGISDLLALEGETVTLDSLPPIEADVRGTGCQLSSALAASLADGDGLVEATERARRYLNDLLHASSHAIGRGRPVVVRGGTREAPNENRGDHGGD